LSSVFLWHPLKATQHNYTNSLNTKVDPITKPVNPYMLIFTIKPIAKRLLFIIYRKTENNKNIKYNHLINKKPKNTKHKQANDKKQN
jgi:hypothetical protein